MTIVKEEEIITVKKSIEENLECMLEVADEFKNKCELLNWVVEMLPLCYETDGGESYYKSLCSVEFDLGYLGNIQSLSNNVDCDYSRERSNYN